MVLLIVDVEAKFGSFNNPSSNVGGLMTYPIPPKTVAQGFLGSILGLKFKETVDVFGDLRYTVRPFFPLETTNVTYNCHYGGRKGRMVNVQQEVLLNPKYRLYFHVPRIKPQDEVLNDIRQRFDYIKNMKKIPGILKAIMSKEESYYTMYMGKNEFPLSYQLQKNGGWERLGEDSVEDKSFIINSAIPRNAVKDYDISVDSEGKSIKEAFSMPESENFRVYNIKNLPRSQNENREFQSFEDVLLKQPKSNVTLKAKLKKNMSKDYTLYRKEREILVCF